jgi:arginase family enzyme
MLIPGDRDMPLHKETVITNVYTLCRGNSEFHLSFDIDAFDPYYAPSTGTAGNCTQRFYCQSLGA